MEISEVAIYPNPADSYVNVNAETDSYAVEVFSMDGRLVLNEQGLHGRQTLDTSALEAGNDLIRFTDLNGLKAVRKLLVKH